jgi:hypothetical protein
MPQWPSPHKICLPVEGLFIVQMHLDTPFQLVLVLYYLGFGTNQVVFINLWMVHDSVSP